MVDTDNPPAAINAKVSGVNLVLITKISSNESSYRSSTVVVLFYFRLTPDIAPSFTWLSPAQFAPGAQRAFAGDQPLA